MVCHTGTHERRCHVGSSERTAIPAACTRKSPGREPPHGPYLVASDMGPGDDPTGGGRVFSGSPLAGAALAGLTGAGASVPVLRSLNRSGFGRDSII